LYSINNLLHNFFADVASKHQQWTERQNLLATFREIYPAKYAWQNLPGKVRLAKYAWQNRPGKVRLAKYAWQISPCTSFVLH
jgi:hypothetical protein